MSIRYIVNGILQITHFLVFLTVAFLLFGCSTKIQDNNINVGKKEKSFLNLYDGIPMNTILVLKTPIVMDEEDMLPGVVILVFNDSEKSISLPSKFGTDILIYDVPTSSWKWLENLVQYYPEKRDEILVPGDIPISVTAAFDYPTSDLPVEVRIVVIGEVLQDGQPTGEKVGAYLDVVVGE